MTDIRAAVATERRELAAVLAALPPSAWDEPTLCAGWRVREVVAHMTAPFRSADPAFVRGTTPDEINRAADELARREAAALSAAELTASLLANADHPWQPGGGFEGALCHDVIHGLDITVALGLRRRVPPAHLAVVLGEVVPVRVAFFGTDLTGVRLRATDLDWEHGSGDLLTGTAQDLLLAVCGRRLPPGHLDGAPAARFSGAGSGDRARVAQTPLTARQA